MAKFDPVDIFDDLQSALLPGWAMIDPLPVRCEWYLWCAEFTYRAIRHPLLGPVPTCARCEARHVELGGNPGFIIGLEDEA